MSQLFHFIVIVVPFAFSRWFAGPFAIIGVRCLLFVVGLLVSYVVCCLLFVFVCLLVSFGVACL